MSRFSLVTLTLVALVALVALAPVVANAAYVSRPLTLIIWKGSVIETYLNFTDVQQDLGLAGGQRYYFKFALGVAEPTIPLVVLIGNGTTYCTVGYVPIDLTYTDRNLWMTNSLPYVQNITYSGIKQKWLLYVTTQDPFVHAVNLTDPNKKEYVTNVYAYVWFNDQYELADAIKAANNGQVPETCKALLDNCVNGCWVRVYGLLVPEDAPLEARTYTVYYTTTVSAEWRAMAKQVKAVPPDTYLVSYEAGYNGTLGFGNTTRVVKLADGSKLYIQGYINVTINWTLLQSDIRLVLGSDLITNNNNVTVTLNVVYRPSVTSVGQTIASSGVHYQGTTSSNITAAGSLLASTDNLPTAVTNLINSVYGTLATSYGFGTHERKGALIFTLVVNPAVPLPLVNKLFELPYTVEYPYGNKRTLQLQLPGACGTADVVVRLNQTISYIVNNKERYVTFASIGVSDLDDTKVPFWSVIAYVPLGKKATIVPASLLVSVKADEYGDNNVINPYDVIKVHLYNLPYNQTKFYIGGTEYTLGLPAANLANNVSVVEAPVINAATGAVLTTAVPNYTAVGVFAGKYLGDNSNGTLLVNYTLRPAQYGGAIYYVLPALKYNLTDTTLYELAIATVPPVNYTDINVKDGDVVYKCGFTVFRVRPALYATAVDYDPATGNYTDRGTNTIYVGGYLAIYGVGFNLDDLQKNGYLFLGNASIPFSKLAGILTYSVLMYGKQMVMKVNTTTGSFAILVPLWRVLEAGYKPLLDSLTGTITINVTGSGENYAWAHGTDETTNTGVDFDTKVTYTIDVAPNDVMRILVDPLTDLAERLTTKNGIDMYDYTWVVVGHRIDPAKKIPAEAYEQYKKLGGAEVAEYYNKAYMMVLLYGVPARQDVTYAIKVVDTNYEAVVKQLTLADLAEGYYHTVVNVPTFPAGVYKVEFYNESSTTAPYAFINITPAVVFYAKETGSVGLNYHWLAIEDVYTSIEAMPNGTVDMYGYGWLPTVPVTVNVDNVPKMSITNISDYGTWYAQLSIPATAAGSTITVVVEQSGYKSGAYVRVIEIKRRGLVVTVGTGPVMYEDGNAKIPVIVTATYYDTPISCTSPIDIMVSIYDQEGRQIVKPVHLTTADCVAEGVWMKPITISVEQVPVYAIIVAKVTYEIKGVAKLTQFATTAVTIDPEIKEGINRAASLASEAAAAASDVKARVEDIARMVTEVSGKLDDISGRLANIAAKLSEVSGKLDTVAAGIADIKKSLSDAAAMMASKLDAIASDVKAIKTAVANLPDQVSAAVKAAVAGLPTKDDIASMIDAAKADIAKMITEEAGKVLSEVRKSTDTITAAINTATDTISKKIDDSTERICNRLGTIEAAVKDLAGKVATKDDVNAIKQELAGIADQVSAKVSSVLDKAVSDIKNAVNSAVNKITGIEKSISELAGKVNDVDSKVSNLSMNTMIFGAGTLIVSIIVLALLILVAVKSGLLASH